MRSTQPTIIIRKKLTEILSKEKWCITNKSGNSIRIMFIGARITDTITLLVVRYNKRKVSIYIGDKYNGNSGEMDRLIDVDKNAPDYQSIIESIKARHKDTFSILNGEIEPEWSTYIEDVELYNNDNNYYATPIIVYIPLGLKYIKNSLVSNTDQPGFTPMFTFDLRSITGMTFRILYDGTKYAEIDKDICVKPHLTLNITDKRIMDSIIDKIL